MKDPERTYFKVLTRLSHMEVVIRNANKKMSLLRKYHREKETIKRDIRNTLGKSPRLRKV